MTVKELIENVKSKEFNLKKELKIKKYLPVIDKKKLAIGVIAECTNDIDDFITVDRFKMNIYFNMSILALYTTLETASNFNEMIEEYDILCEKGIFQKIVALIQDEYDVSRMVLEDEVKDFLLQNSIEAQVVKIANKVDGILDIVVDKLDGIDFKTILPKGMDVGKLSNIFNMLK